MAANVFFPSGTPKIFKVCTSLLISAMVGINIEASITVGSTYELIVFAILETVNGLVLGYIVNLCFYSLKIAGNLIDYQIGLSMSSTYDPNTNANATIIENFMYFIGLVVFFGLNAHHVLINSILNSFEIIPIGYSIIDNNFGYIIKVFIEYFIIGMKIASPIVLILIITDLITGIISRSISGLNVMIIGMPLKMLIGLIFIIATLPFIINEIQEIFKGLGSVMDGTLSFNLQVLSSYLL
ncbi:flagellar biosynthetic protein FliR [Clostridium collagenovorans DSM 3089]|uniref:Flagellar biosynthetic protein FliR n=2 Tax=Clostridium TaxID=1485 RepID=A0A1M5WQG0_9CLOT|nr:flagellar biosynthetic protein FliR [Clostridium collagenovorans]SHH89836.1 flagellar biosynthetic protein FliR [Clostridium collagenovorans DSM 3089]